MTPPTAAARRAADAVIEYVVGTTGKIDHEEVARMIQHEIDRPPSKIDCPANHDAWVCTLRLGHDGQHEAWGSEDKPYFTWGGPS